MTTPEGSPTLAELFEELATIPDKKLKIEPNENTIERDNKEEKLGEHEDWLLEQIAILSPSQD